MNLFLACATSFLAAARDSVRSITFLRCSYSVNINSRHCQTQHRTKEEKEVILWCPLSVAALKGTCSSIKTPSHCPSPSEGSLLTQRLISRRGLTPSFTEVRLIPARKRLRLSYFRARALNPLRVSASSCCIRFLAEV